MTRHVVNFLSPVQFERRNRFLWEPSLDRRAGCTPHVFALIAALSTTVTLFRAALSALRERCFIHFVTPRA